MLRQIDVDHLKNISLIKCICNVRILIINWYIIDICNIVHIFLQLKCSQKTNTKLYEKLFMKLPINNHFLFNILWTFYVLQSHNSTKNFPISFVDTLIWFINGICYMVQRIFLLEFCTLIEIYAKLFYAVLMFLCSINVHRKPRLNFILSFLWNFT